MNAITSVTHQELQQRNDTSLLAWGLSKTTKTHWNTLPIRAIVDNNPKLTGAFFQNIPIISPAQLHQWPDPIVLWGGHLENILAKIESLGLANEILIHQELTKSPLFALSQHYLSPNNNLQQKMYLFKKMVRLVELEPHSYCNRTCWFCPNSYLDRRSNTKFMDESILQKLIHGLAEINYDQTISFTRYSEPFGNDVFYSTLKKIRSSLPRATLHANTNGDFLTDTTLSKAYESGLNSLNIQLYLPQHQPFEYTYIQGLAEKTLKKIPSLKATLSQKTDDWIEFACTFKTMHIRMYARDFRKNGNPRGDIIPSPSLSNRASPCFLPFSDLYIDHTGDVVPCCNIRSDDPKQRAYVLGNIQEHETIFDMYFSKNFLSWRERLWSFGPKTFPPCKSCHFASIDFSHYIDNHLKKKMVITKE